MNQHKFKAWHIADKRWIKGFWISADGKSILVEVGHHGERRGLFYEVGKEVDLVAWTEECDVDGDEIYEGHICTDKDDNLGEIIHTRGGTYSIEYKSGLVDFFPIDLKIIGHKLENPELLEAVT